MGMPNDLVLVRHGLSEGNVATNASNAGDDQWYTDTFTTTPGHRWRLTETGRAQARTIGTWISSEFDPFDRFYVSPFVRTRETAGHLGLVDASWQLNRSLRERDWGDIGTLPRAEFERRAEYQLNAWLKTHDPLYWSAPNGESIANVAENRVRNVLSTLHRECTEKSVVCVTHGEAMLAFRLVLERLDDETFAQIEGDETEKIHNCEVLHYSRLDPDTGEQSPRLSWLRRARPIRVGAHWNVTVSPWVQLKFSGRSNEDLLASVADVPQLFPDLPH